MLSPEERRPAPLSLRPLPAFLADTGGSKLLYIVKAWLLIFIPSLAISAGVSLLADDAAGPEFGATGLTLWVLLVIVAPSLETLLMIAPLLAMQRLFGPRAAIVGSAILWGIAHSLAEPLWGLVAWWPFLILSAVMLAVRRDQGIGMAILVVTAVHALQNGAVASILLLD